MTAPWWAGLASAQVTVPCGGQQHTVRWAEGLLTTPDHADLEGERALAALGGEPNTCVQIADAWARHRDDLDVLLLASRGPADIVRLPGDARPGIMPMRYGGRPTAATISAGPIAATGPAAQSGWRATAPHTGPVPAEHQDVADLLGLGGGLPQRLVATIAAEWATRISDQDSRVPAAVPKLTAALYGRALAAVRGWLQDPDLDITVGYLPPGTTPTATRGGGNISLGLPFHWLIDVWAKDLTTTAGRFCLAATASRSGDWALSTVGSDCGPPTTLNVGRSRP